MTTERGKFEHLRKAFDDGNGFALVIATIECSELGRVLPEWVVEAWSALRDRYLDGKLKWDKALEPKDAKGKKVKSTRHKAHIRDELAIHRYHQHRFTIDLQRSLGRQVDDPLEGLAKDSDKFKAGLAKVMELPVATALGVYNTKVPKAERYPYKSRVARKVR